VTKLHTDPIEQLFYRRRGAIIPTLDRMRAAYDHLGRPLADIPSILVAGTNGKGTTGAFLWALASTDGASVGFFSSPHLRHYSERFWVKGRRVEPACLFDCLAHIKKVLPASLFDSLTFFEIMTILALVVFQRKNCQRVILEVGMGGGWDATNVIEPVASVITSVDFDHTDYLGDSLIEIATQKAGVARKGRPLVWAGGGELGEDQVCEAKFLEICRSKGAEVLKLAKSPSSLSLSDALLHKIITENLPLKVQHAGYFHQNLYTAIMAASSVSWLEDDIQHQVHEALRLPLPPNLRARYDELQLSSGQQLLLDVCHNVDGAKSFAVALRRAYSKPLPAFISILVDKDFNQILDIFRDVLNPILLFRSENERSWKASDLGQQHRDLKFFDNFEQAWHHTGQNKNLGLDFPGVVCGSVVVMGEVLDYFNVPEEYPAFGAPLSGNDL
jgi:dihydrofolate synthase / folylpolyglutamate synthase